MKPIFAAKFWNEEVSSSTSLDAVSHSLSREPPPFGMVVGSHMSRSQQLLLVQRMMWIPCTPSYVVHIHTSAKLPHTHLIRYYSVMLPANA